MTSRSRLGVAIVSALVLSGVALSPAIALAQAHHGGSGRGSSMGGGPRIGGSPGGGSRPVAGRPFSPGRSFSPGHVSRSFSPGNVSRPFFPHRFASRPFFRPFFPFGVIGGPVVYAAPYYWGASSYGMPSYYDSPAYDQPAAAYAAPSVSLVPPPPSAPPVQNVIEYPNGRYELRGDGVSTPYTWVWIPAAPPPPPTGPPTGPDQPTSSSPREIYRWTDGDGVLHVTDRLAAVPAPYRAQAKQAAQP